MHDDLVRCRVDVLASDLAPEVDDLLIHIWLNVCLIPATLEHAKSHVIALDVRISTANAILESARFIHTLVGAPLVPLHITQGDIPALLNSSGN
jgi:hypothetical protein